MPSRPPTTCPIPTCPHTTPCPDHTPKAWASSTRGGSTRRWRKTRQTILKRDPWCALCGTAPSAEVDHVVPRSQGGGDEQSNLRGLCSLCHKGETQRQAQAARRRHIDPALWPQP